MKQNLKVVVERRTLSDECPGRSPLACAHWCGQIVRDEWTPADDLD